MVLSSPGVKLALLSEGSSTDVGFWIGEAEGLMFGSVIGGLSLDGGLNKSTTGLCRVKGEFCKNVQELEIVSRNLEIDFAIPAQKIKIRANLFNGIVSDLPSDPKSPEQRRVGEAAWI